MKPAVVLLLAVLGTLVVVVLGWLFYRATLGRIRKYKIENAFLKSEIKDLDKVLDDVQGELAQSVNSLSDDAIIKALSHIYYRQDIREEQRRKKEIGA